MLDHARVSQHTTPRLLFRASWLLVRLLSHAPPLLAELFNSVLLGQSALSVIDLSVVMKTAHMICDNFLLLETLSIIIVNKHRASHCPTILQLSHTIGLQCTFSGLQNVKHSELIETLCISQDTPKVCIFNKL